MVARSHPQNKETTQYCRSIAKPMSHNQNRISGDEKPKKCTNPNKILEECRWKNQSMSCFFERRAGNPSAIIRQRSIVHAIAGRSESNNAVVSLTESQTKTRYDKDPLERKLQGGCVSTMQSGKRLAAECRVETTHRKPRKQEEQGCMGIAAIVVNEDDKTTTNKKSQESGTSSVQAERQLRA